MVVLLTHRRAVVADLVDQYVMASDNVSGS